MQSALGAELEIGKEKTSCGYWQIEWGLKMSPKPAGHSRSSPGPTSGSHSIKRGLLCWSQRRALAPHWSISPYVKGETDFLLAGPRPMLSRQKGRLTAHWSSRFYLHTSKCRNARNKYIFASTFAGGHKVTSAFLLQLLKNMSVPCVRFSLFIFQGKIIMNGILRKFLLYTLRI